MSTRGERERLPMKRKSITYELVMRTSRGNRRAYLTMSVYPDGRVGEVFLKTAKSGSELRTAMSQWAIAVSLGIQHGVPARKFASTFRGVRCVPGELVCDVLPEVNGECGSLWDAVARVIEVEVEIDGFHRDFKPREFAGPQTQVMDPDETATGKRPRCKFGCEGTGWVPPADPQDGPTKTAGPCPLHGGRVIEE